MELVPATSPVKKKSLGALGFVKWRRHFLTNSSVSFIEMDMTFMVSIRLNVVAKDSKGINDENPDEEVERGGPDEVVKKRERKIQFASNEN